MSTAPPPNDSWISVRQLMVLIGVVSAAAIGFLTTLLPPALVTPTTATTPLVSPPPPVPLTSKNIRFRGLQLCPTDGDPNRKYSPPYLQNNEGGMTVRAMSDGSIRFLIVGQIAANFTPTTTGLPNDGDLVVECSNAGFSLEPTKASRSAITKVYQRPDIYATVLPLTIPSASGYVSVGQLNYANGNLIWPFGPFYAVTALSNTYPCIGLSVLQLDGVTWQAYGPWSTWDGINNYTSAHNTRGYSFPVFSGLASFFNGPCFGVGAGIYAGSTTASYGPGFVLCQMPTSTTPPAVLQSDGSYSGGTTLSTKVVSYYPNSNNNTHLCPRPRFLNEAGLPAPFYDSNNQPTTTAVDASGNPISGWAQVDNANCAINLFVSNIGGGTFYFGYRATTGSTVWYGISPDNNTGASQAWVDPTSVAHGYHATGWEDRAWVQSFGDQYNVLNGKIQSWQVSIVDDFSPSALAGFALQPVGRSGATAVVGDPTNPAVFYTLHNYSGVVPSIAKWEVVAVGAP